MTPGYSRDVNVAIATTVNLNILNEYGLIITDYNSWMDYRIAIASDMKVPLPPVYQGASWGLVTKQASGPSAEFCIHGVGFSRAGRELLPIVDVDQNEQYGQALKAFLENQGKTMVQIR